jgi:hypothetical protein
MKNINSSKGGRPSLKIKKDQQLSTQVNLLDRKIIEKKAMMCNLTVSEYLREHALEGKINVNIKTLPKEVLQLTGTLNHNAANINQIAFQLNSKNLLSKSDFIKLEGLIDEIVELVKTIRKEFKK